LADIEDHLNVTIQQVDENLKVPMNEFDGKVVYGQKRINVGKYINYFQFITATQGWFNGGVTISGHAAKGVRIFL
jgi:hypothetical protein